MKLTGKRIVSLSLVVGALCLLGAVALTRAALVRPFDQPATWWTLFAWPLALMGAAALEEGVDHAM